MKKFRIKVDLSTFFEDERKLACILVDPNWKSVQCLQQRVEQIFEVENLCFVTDDGCFIPPQESIEVIKSNDVLKAFLRSTPMTKKKKKCKKQKETDANTNSLEFGVKKRKFKLLEQVNACSTPNQAKRSRNAAAVCFETLHTVAQNKAVYEAPTSTNECLGLLDKQKQDQKIDESIAKPQKKSLNKSENMLNENQTIISSPVVKKKIRKEKTDKDQPTLQIQKVSRIEETKISDSFSTRSSSTIRNEIQSNKNKISSNSTKGHFYFNDTGEAVAPTSLTQGNTSALQKSCSISSPKLFFRCQLAKLPLDTPRVFALKKTENSKSPEIENLSTDMTNTVHSAEIEKLSTDGMNITNLPDNKKKSLIEIREHIIISAVNCTTAKLGKCNEESMETDEEPKTNSVSMTDSLITEYNNNSTRNNESTELDESIIIALDSEEEDDESDETDENEEFSKEKKRTHRSKQEQDSPDVSEVIDLNATDEESDSTVRRKKASSQQYREFLKGNRSIKDILRFTTRLEELPSNGDVIVFKLRRLDNKITDYIAGKCEYTNKRVKNIRLGLIEGIKEFDYIPDRYKCSLDDSSALDNPCLNIKFNEMIGPRKFEC